MNKTQARKRVIPVPPTIVKRKVSPHRPDADYRGREYLSEKEVGAVIAVATTTGAMGLAIRP